MTTKQVQVANEVHAEGATPQNKALYISVKTFNAEGKTIGERVVDMYHFGTRNWLANHTWWATHNSHEIEISVASDEDVQAYIAETAKALQSKFQKAEEPIAA